MAANAIELTGDLTMDRPKASDEALAQLPPGPECLVDLAGVGEADSSAIALMIRLQRRAEVNDTKLRFANVPGSLRKLIDFYGLNGVLELERAG